MIDLVFYSRTGQVRRLIKKLNSNYHILELIEDKPTLTLDNKCILLVPTYEDGLEFLDSFVDENKSRIIGLIGSGNRNFGPEFCHVVRRYNKTYNIPILYEFEFSGTREDVVEIEKIIKLKEEVIN